MLVQENNFWVDLGDKALPLQLHKASHNGTTVRMQTFSYSPHIPLVTLRTKMGKKGAKMAQNPEGLADSGKPG